MATRNYRLSQNFLRSPRLALKLIGHSNIRKRDLVVEVGAGSGVITTALAKRAREVWAIEPDKVAAGKLRANLEKYGVENVRVIERDFREVRLPEGQYKVFANPPFHLAAEVFYWLLGLENVGGEIRERDGGWGGGEGESRSGGEGEDWGAGRGESRGEGADEVRNEVGGGGNGRCRGRGGEHHNPRAIYLILQKQMALKLIPTDRHYTSQLGRKIIEEYDARIRLPLRREDFTPPPGVPVVFYEAKRREG